MMVLAGLKRRMTSVLQAEPVECGLACLTMLANFHGQDVSLSSLRSRFPLSQRGMTLAEIVELGGQLELDARCVVVSSIAELQAVRCPALLNWTGDHVVVLEKVVGTKFIVHDPAFGRRIYGASDMRQYFGDMAVEFEPRMPLGTIDRATKPTVWSVLRACRGMDQTIATVAILSFVAGLFALATPVLLQIALDSAIPKLDFDLVATVAIGMALFLALETSAKALRDRVTLRAATLFEIHFTRTIIGHALRLPVTFFERRHPGDLLTRLSLIGQIKTLLVSGCVSSLADGAMSVLLVLMMVHYSPVMTAIALSTLTIALVLRLLTYPAIEAQTLARLEARSQEQAVLLDGLKGMAALKVHNTTQFFGMTWLDHVSRFANRDFAAGKRAIGTDFLLQIVFMLGTVATLYVGVTDVMKHITSIGILFAFFALRSVFFDNMTALIRNLLHLSIMGVYAERLGEVLDAAAEPAGHRVAIDRDIRRGVALADVRIQFDQSSRPILDGLSLSIDVANQEAIAITGASGSGKSSLLKVLASLHRPAGGRLVVDGQALDAFGLQEYRANIGAVFAEDCLFAGTILDNITMYSPDISRIRVEEALKTVDLLDEIYRLPQSLATPVSSESPILSTGQKRRLLLARALARQPRLLLLDDVTANLDPATEDRVIHALLNVPAAKVFVTHSERVLIRVDKTYKVVDGQLLDAQFGRPKLIA